MFTIYPVNLSRKAYSAIIKLTIGISFQVNILIIVTSSTNTVKLSKLSYDLTVKSDLIYLLISSPLMSPLISGGEMIAEPEEILDQSL